MKPVKCPFWNSRSFQKRNKPGSPSHARKTLRCLYEPASSIIWDFQMSFASTAFTQVLTSAVWLDGFKKTCYKPSPAIKHRHPGTLLQYVDEHNVPVWFLPISDHFPPILNFKFSDICMFLKVFLNQHNNVANWTVLTETLHSQLMSAVKSNTGISSVLLLLLLSIFGWQDTNIHI